MMGHPSERTLNDHVDGLLSAAEGRRVEAHLAGCARCRAEEAALHALVGRLGSLPAPAAPRDLRPEIAARVASSGG
ncbi:MAG TPA: zf-HC2 domain-containing protein, partial [Longimicrobiaceae bacterium]|nr:zf-HC2 domain-containing protein [Longimicrobiaceae bacterium]